MEWLLSPLVPDRPHVLTDAQMWHARLMFLAWGVLAPLAVIVARFFKVLPQQDWPRQLDNQFWWRSHWVGQSLVLVLTLLAVSLVYRLDFSSMDVHSQFGYVVLVLVAFQIALGYFRGSKGGPTAPDGKVSGDHYEMNLRRRVFEVLHKSLGYGLLLLAAATTVLGLWQVNAPVWMWLCIGAWWVSLVLVFIRLQQRGYAIDTYQAIWGPDLQHPGNNMASAGWGMRRVRADKHSAVTKSGQ